MVIIAAVRSKAVVLLLLIYLWFVFGHCFVTQHLVTFLVSQSYVLVALL